MPNALPNALIGWSGLVGGTLLRQTNFDDRFRSSDIGDIAGREYDLVVCAGMPAEKWRANKEPERDRAALDRLWQPLSGMKASRVVVISTVDVFATPIGVTEESPVDVESLAAYGRHRYELERRVADHFDSCIIRLPALFGKGLKKNVIYDLLHDNMVDAICAESVFQFYPLDRLWRDVQVALDTRLTLVHLAVEGTQVSDVAREGFGRTLQPTPDRTAVTYDFRTVHAQRFGGSGAYVLGRNEVLAAIAEFVRQERAP